MQLNLTLKNVWNSRDKAVEVLKLKLDEERGTHLRHTPRGGLGRSNACS